MDYSYVNYELTMSGQWAAPDQPLAAQWHGLSVGD